MLITNRYMCEKCGREYDREDECMECESSHRIPVEILSRKYRMTDYESSCTDRRYPLDVWVAMDDGSIAKYRFVQRA